MSRLLVFLSAVGALAMTPAFAGPPFLVFEGTASPNGRFALAWGLPKDRKVDWDDLRSGGDPSEAELDEFVSDAENYVVDVEAGKILATIEGAQMWAVPGKMAANRRSLDACWSPKNDIVLAVYGERWGYASFNGYRVADGKAGPPLDLGPILEKAARRFFATKFPKKYKRLEDDLYFDFGALAADGDRKFSARVFAFVPKSVNDDDSFDRQRIHFTVEPAGALQLNAKVGAIEPEDRFDDPLENRLAAADRLLNEVYGQLRKALPAGEKAELKQEQLAWLKKRDEEGDLERRAVLVEERVGVLRERVKRLERRGG